jgi:hypothetical protein
MLIYTHINKRTHLLAGAGDVHEVEGEGLELVLVQALEAQNLLVEGQRLGGVLDLPRWCVCGLGVRAAVESNL